MVVVAEWLRRWTRNPLGSPRAGSNPADYESHSFGNIIFFLVPPFNLEIVFTIAAPAFDNVDKY